MSGLDNLTSKIIKDAQARALEITDAADAQAKAIVAEAEAEAAKEKDRILADADTEAAHAAEQITLGKTLAIRDENLEAKQQMLDKVFTAVMDSLNAMDQAAFEKFLIAHLTALDPDGEELILPERFSIGIDKINAALKEAGKKGNLVMSAEKRAISGGFILCKNGIEQNNTFESLVNFHRYDLESDVLKMLY
ncbi:MAG: V-type ATP synthase subunit E [Oscillospiraceae bacterium]|nr:V-type ATP synthase subunit E [Oscillospiraceae bacterium]